MIKLIEDLLNRRVYITIKLTNEIPNNEASLILPSNLRIHFIRKRQIIV